MLRSFECKMCAMVCVKSSSQVDLCVECRESLRIQELEEKCARYEEALELIICESISVKVCQTAYEALEPQTEKEG